MNNYDFQTADERMDALRSEYGDKPIGNQLIVYRAMLRPSTFISLPHIEKVKFRVLLEQVISDLESGRDHGLCP